MWDDSNGDYGNEKCSGYLKQQNKKVELEIFCETINQNNEKFWNSRTRKSDEDALTDCYGNYVDIKGRGLREFVSNKNIKSLRALFIIETKNNEKLSTKLIELIQELKQVHFILIFYLALVV